MADPTILQQQIAYYQARATEYDEWFYRQGRYDRGAEINNKWHTEAATARDALHTAVHALGPVAHALELAPGTGIWTQELVKLADHVTAVDASAEMLEINRHKVGAAPITYEQADLFLWEPTAQYDVVFFSFWLSHVPPEQLDPFLAKVRRALRPGGKAFMIDSRRDETSLPSDHALPDEGFIHTRKLNDGRAYQIVKIFYTPDTLRAAFARNGLDAVVQETDTFFIYAQATAA
ncbi:MAG: class I SAM-dependent methyltransferase [Litorilinea sp.]